MTPEQFWNDDPDYFWAYLEAYEQEKRAQLEYDNQVAFLQGLYFTKALAQCLQFTKVPKKIYPKKPISLNLTEDSEERKFREFEEYESKRKAQMKMLAKQFELKNKTKK